MFIHLLTDNVGTLVHINLIQFDILQIFCRFLYDLKTIYHFQK